MVTEKLSEISAERVESELLDRPVRGLYDIAYLYGKLSILNDAARVQGVDAKYVSYLTPGDSIDSEFGKENSAILLQLEWNDSTEQFEYKGVKTRTVDWEFSARLGYCRPDNKSSQKTVHSITKMTSGSGNDADKISTYLGSDLFDWFDTITDEAAEGTDDKWLYDKVKDFTTENLVDKIETELRTQYEGAFPMTGLMSLELHIDGDVIYPGETECFNEGMRENKKDRLYKFSKPIEGVCYITGESGEVFGRAPGSPFEFFSSEAQGPFWKMDADYSARERPLSSDAIFALIRGKDMIIEFSKSVTPDDRLAYVPYFKTLSYEKAIEMYRGYLNAVDADAGIEPAADWISEPSVTGDTKYLYGLYYTEQQASVYVIHRESKEISELRLNKIEGDRIDSIDSLRTFDSIVQYDEDSWFYNPEVRLPQYLLSGQLFREVIGEDSTHTSPFNLALQVAIGEQLTKKELYKQFAQRLREDYRWAKDNDGSVSPSYRVWKQELLLNILSRAGSFGETGEHLIRKTEISKDMTRKERFDAFVQNHTALDDNPSIGAFTLGALVGRLSAVQSFQLDVSKVLYDQYPSQSITLQNFQQIVQEAVEKNHQYMSAYQVPLYSQYTELLTDVCLSEDISDWDVSTNELRYFYALGVSYGYSDTMDYSEADNEEATEMPEQ